MGFFSKVKKKIKRSIKKVDRSIEKGRKTLVGGLTPPEAPKAAKPKRAAAAPPTPEQASFDASARRTPRRQASSGRGTLLTGALGLVGAGPRKKRKTLLGR